METNTTPPPRPKSTLPTTPSKPNLPIINNPLSKPTSLLLAQESNLLEINQPVNNPPPRPSTIAPTITPSKVQDDSISNTSDISSSPVRMTNAIQWRYPLADKDSH